MSDLSQSKAPFFFQTNKPKKKTSRSDSTVPCPCVYAIYAEGDAQASNNEANEKEEGEAAAPAATAEEEEEEEGEIEEGEAPPDDDSDQGKTRHEYEEIVAGCVQTYGEILFVRANVDKLVGHIVAGSESIADKIVSDGPTKVIDGQVVEFTKVRTTYRDEGVNVRFFFFFFLSLPPPLPPLQR